MSYIEKKTFISEKEQDKCSIEYQNKKVEVVMGLSGPIICKQSQNKQHNKVIIINTVTG